MGVKITELVPAREIEFRSLAGRVVAVDASLFLYQFLTTIRQPDGSLLTDSKGRVTSHLVGLFSRTTKLLSYGIKLCYVFDGEPPKLKTKEQQRRRELKAEAQERYQAAVERADLLEMGKYGRRTASLTPELTSEAKHLLQALGVPVVQAPSEAEAQASFMASSGTAYAVATQDADALMFGAPRIVRNLSLVGRRKTANKLSYESVKPEIVDLAETLNSLGIDRDQFIALCMLVGTDYNIGGIKGVGPKNAIKAVQQHRKDFDGLFSSVGWDSQFDVSWKEIFRVIKEMPVVEAKLSWNPVDAEMVRRLLVEEHNFAPERVESSLAALLEEKSSKQQKGLGEYF